MARPSGRIKRLRARGKNPASPDEPPHHALGRSRGGWGTKIHLVTDGKGLPLTAVLSPGQAHEAQYVDTALQRIRVGRRTRPTALAGDKGYDVPRVRTYLAHRVIAAVIPPKQWPAHWRTAPPPPWRQRERQTYQRRNVIERTVNWLKEHRAVATRYDKLAVHYLATLQLAMLRKHLRTLINTP